jgi:hypothetical protein
MPEFLSLTDYNQQLLGMCEEDADREHYRYNATIEELFAEDLKHCHPLPNMGFDLSGRKSVTTNNWGKFYLNKGMHEYPVSPRYANTAVNLKLTSALVIVLDENYREIVRHRRLYGDTKQQSMDLLPYLGLRYCRAFSRKRFSSTKTRVCCPCPISLTLSRAVTVNSMVRPLTFAILAVAVISLPIRLAAVWVTFICTPTEVCPGVRRPAKQAQAACSINAIIMGVANTSRLPLPTALAVLPSSTTTWAVAS